jgi:hypothetical protein
MASGDRASEAGAPLLYTNWPARRAGGRVGYSDGANFANRFRRLTVRLRGLSSTGRKPSQGSANL